MPERWARAAGFPAYEVSTSGRVRRRHTGRLCGIWLDSNGYPSVSLQVAGDWRKPTCHLLVWRSFRGPVPHPLTVDHRDRNRGNPRLGNLRLATRRQQQANSDRSHAHTHSDYRGVCYHINRGYWVARIRDGGKQLHLGCFENEADAARAYDVAARKAFGKFAILNFARRR